MTTGVGGYAVVLNKRTRNSESKEREKNVTNRELEELTHSEAKSPLLSTNSAGAPLTW